MKAVTRNALKWGAAGAAAGMVAHLVNDQLTGISFRDKVVVVTGASRGLGLVLCRQLAKEGATLAICARNHEELTDAVHDLRSLGGKVSAQVCDLANPSQIKMFFENVRKELGPVDVLINNAGVIQVGPLENMTLVDFENALKIHLWAVMHAVESVLPDMRARGCGRIVNVASIGGQVAIPHLLPYTVSKFALVGYSQGLNSELAKDGIKVTTVCPGLMRTGSHHHALFKGQHRSEFSWFSLGGAIPGLTISAESAARQIVHACRHGKSRVTLSAPARFAVAMDTLAPQLTACVSGLINRLLPAPGGIGEQQRKGYDSHSAAAPSWATLLSERAAARNNELKPTNGKQHAPSDEKIDIEIEDSFPASDPPSFSGATGTASGN